MLLVVLHGLATIDALLLCNGHLREAAPAVAPHPDVHLVEPQAAAIAPFLLHVGRGATKTPIVLEPVWNRGATVAADETWNEGGAPQHMADVEAGQELVAGKVIEHGHSSLCDAVRSQIHGLKRAEVREGNLLMRSTVPRPLGSYGHKVELKNN